MSCHVSYVTTSRSLSRVLHNSLLVELPSSFRVDDCTSDWMFDQNPDEERKKVTARVLGPLRESVFLLSVCLSVCLLGDRDRTNLTLDSTTSTSHIQLQNLPTPKTSLSPLPRPRGQARKYRARTASGPRPARRASRSCCPPAAASRRFRAVGRPGRGCLTPRLALVWECRGAA
jgi:hypothetical protein